MPFLSSSFVLKTLRSLSLMQFLSHGCHCGPVNETVKHQKQIELLDFNMNHDGTLRQAPGDPKDVHFFLYTPNNPEFPDELIVDDVDSIANSNFIINAPVKFMVHGFNGASNNSFPSDLKAKYLNESTGDLNVILMDWSILATGSNYIQAAINSQVAGAQGGKLVEFLINLGANTLDRFHLIGHSLGAHTSGKIGHHIFTTMNSKIPRITGLDPAKPLFELANNDLRLDRNDADFVDVIHTSGVSYGFFRPIGTVDFYPNGGVIQPGCTLNLGCSHERSHEYFTESVSDPKGFIACKCPDPVLGIPSLLNCLCDENDATSLAYMGEFVSKTLQGTFSLKTNSKTPFAMGKSKRI